MTIGEMNYELWVNKTSCLILTIVKEESWHKNGGRDENMTKNKDGVDMGDFRDQADSKNDKFQSIGIMMKNR